MLHVIADFRVEHKDELDEKLAAALTAAHSDALSGEGLGVLVTRHDFDHFSVALSPNVPFGVIREADEASRN